MLHLSDCWLQRHKMLGRLARLRSPLVQQVRWERQFNANDKQRKIRLSRRWWWLRCGTTQQGWTSLMSMMITTRPPDVIDPVQTPELWWWWKIQGGRWNVHDDVDSGASAWTPPGRDGRCRRGSFPTVLWKMPPSVSFFLHFILLGQMPSSGNQMSSF